FEQTQNKGQMHLCQTTRPITKFGTLSKNCPKKSTDIAFLYLRPWPKNRHAARATFPHRKFLPDF
ncbi:hypothetical protein, partial [uncultured Victivallis sp.]|uniref:hypothetical protein n=1 Tax=uncultured Victivallis sp. TaxID=354118 RepID=UPI0025D25749